MKRYDLIVSLGSSCGVTMAMRRLYLQTASLPFDWLGSPSLPDVVAMIESDFANWFEKKDFVLWNVSHEKGVIHRFYKNVRTGFGFPHEFSNAEPFETNFERVREKYVRRTDRFRADLSKPGRVLFVYLEPPYAQRLPEAGLIEALDRLRAKFPSADADLLYLYIEPERKEEVETRVSERITSVGLDYRIFHQGRLMHLTETGMLTQCLAGRCALVKPLTEEEIREVRRREREKWLAPFGRNPVMRRINREIHSWYCRLEDYLISQHLLPGDKDIWFTGEGK